MKTKVKSIEDTTENKAPIIAPVKHIESECKQFEYGPFNINSLWAYVVCI